MECHLEVLRCNQSSRHRSPNSNIWEAPYRAMNAEIEDTMWMEQPEEDVRRPMRQESTTTHEGKDPRDDYSAGYVVRDGDSASH